MPGESSSNRSGHLKSTCRSVAQNLGAVLTWGILLGFGGWELWPLITFYFGG